MTDVQSGTRYALSQPMMSLRILVVSGLTLGAVGACTNGGDGPDGTIDYSRAGGFGGARLSLHVDPDGKATRVKTDGTTVTIQYADVTLAELKRGVDDARFPTLEAAYSCDCADDFLHTISVRVGGSDYTVMADDTAAYPDRLRPLIGTLKDLTNEIIRF
ncbi:MAG TPA: hypothetical protein VGD80_02165 [Kofleriaceae bacterium]